MSEYGAVATGVFALVVCVVALLPRAEVRSPSASLLRVLVPSWRFFDDIAPTPLLLARVRLPDQEPGAWREVIQVPPRTPGTLFWNPEGNLSLAAHSLLDRLQMDLAELDAAGAPPAQELTSYKLVLNLVQSSLVLGWPAEAGARVQFKLAERITRGNRSPSDVMISLEHEL